MADETRLPAAPVPSPAANLVASPSSLSAGTPNTAVTASPPALSVTTAAPLSGVVMEQSPTPPTPIAAQSASSAAISNDIDNFEFVSKGLWRGAQPSRKAIAKLAESGVKTIIDLRLAGSGVEDEALVAKQYGISYVNIPMGFGNPSMGDVARFLAIVTKPSNQPKFVHCRQGADRTGTVIGVFRILHDHWSFTEAYNEMRLHHFKPWLSNLKSLVARCEGDPKLSKELTELASKQSGTVASTSLSSKSQAGSI